MTDAIPNQGDVHWVSEPDTRGTASLIWHCISTIFICTWSALHLNVPAEGQSHLQLFKRKMVSLALALLAPEYIAYAAFVDWLAARETARIMSSYMRKGDWNRTLSMFVHMGGIVVQTKDNTRFRLPADNMNLFFQNGWLDIKQFSANIVNDKSKANYFTKMVAFVQINWFCSQLIGRAVSHLPVSTLELFTLAYIVCAIGSYILWWHKPFDVEVPLIVHATDAFTHREKGVIVAETRYSSDFVAGIVDAIGDNCNGEDNWQEKFSFVVFTVLFATCHLLGWNAHFPTGVERILWQTGSAGCIGLILVIFGLVDDRVKAYFYKSEIGKICHNAVFWVLHAFYTIVRVLLFVEAFLALRSTSPRIYMSVPWTDCFPHM